MTYNILKTGSKGNAVVINDLILIDCGTSYKTLKEIHKTLQIVLLTHLHSDHFNKTTIKKLAFERPTLRFACCEWLVEPLVNCGVDKRNIDVLKIGNEYDYKLFKIKPIKLYHNIPNCGYKIYFGDEKLVYATDTGHLEGIQALNYNLYMIECNYVDEEIQERIKAKQEQKIYPYELDVLNNHLSKNQCDNFIYENIGNNGEYVYLHQHQDKE